VDTHADAHVAAALDSIGGLPGVQGRLARAKTSAHARPVILFAVIDTQ
jgi:hypothetical protein